jgi:hypothetical protein
MAKRPVTDSAGKEPSGVGEQRGLSERMRELILRSTVEERRTPSNGNGNATVGKRRRRTDDTSDDSES